MRAILAGIPAGRLNSASIRRFLERESFKGKLKLSSSDIEYIINGEKQGNREEVSTIIEDSTEVVSEDLQNEPEGVEDTDSEVIPTNDVEETESRTFSLENTKSELQAAADELGVSYKKSFSKSKLLELINNN